MDDHNTPNRAADLLSFFIYTIHKKDSGQR